MLSLDYRGFCSVAQAAAGLPTSITGLWSYQTSRTILVFLFSLWKLYLYTLCNGATIYKKRKSMQSEHFLDENTAAFIQIEGYACRTILKSSTDQAQGYVSVGKSSAVDDSNLGILPFAELCILSWKKREKGANRSQSTTLHEVL